MGDPFPVQFLLSFLNSHKIKYPLAIIIKIPAIRM